MRCHPFGERVEEHRHDDVGFEQLVALEQQLVVRLDMPQVFPVNLRKNEIQVLTPLFPCIVDQGCIERRDHHHRQQADMLRETGIGLGPAPEDFLPPAPDRRGDFLLGSAVHLVEAAKRGFLRTVGIDILVGRGEVALGHRQIVDGVEQVGLPRSVAAIDA